jgi:predicted TIM-barrel fold metal-dependent hydrolase
MGSLEDYPPSPRRSYTPRIATLADWEVMASQTGLERQVLVQASAYGVDNRCMLDALRTGGLQRCRGVAVIDHTVSDTELKEMQRLGVRGVRLNAATFGVQDPKAIGAELEATIARVAPLGWHVQIFASLSVLDILAPLLMASSVPIVVDHMGMPDAALGVDQPGFASVLALLKAGHGWVKLSGCYRVSRAAPDYPDAGPIVRALIDANPKRVVWGTDWPHTGAHGSSAKSGEIPMIEYRPLNDGHLLGLFAGWCGEIATFRRAMVDNPAELYSF